jgi:hypothetical protein
MRAGVKTQKTEGETMEELLQFALSLSRSLRRFDGTRNHQHSSKSQRPILSSSHIHHEGFFDHLFERSHQSTIPLCSLFEVVPTFGP